MGQLGTRVKLYFLFFIISNLYITKGEESSGEHDCNKKLLAFIEENHKSAISRKLEENVSRINSLCDLKMLASTATQHDTWNSSRLPEKDILDALLICKTGCSYVALNKILGYELESVTFDGRPLEWKVAVRGQQDAVIDLTEFVNRLIFLVGGENNTVSKLIDRNSGTTWSHPTPGLLSEDRYVPVYVKIDKETLSVGLECDSEPFATMPFAPKIGQSFKLFLYSWSNGVKYIYDCPLFTDIKVIQYDTKNMN